MKYIVIILTSLTFHSCSGWLESEEKEFKEQCVKDVSKAYRNGSGSSPEEGQSEATCDCIFEKIKEDYTYDRYNTEQTSPEVQKIINSCIMANFDLKLD